VTLVSFAYGAGILATVNPCGFAVLPAFHLGDNSQTTRPGLSRLGDGLVVGGAVSAGFAGVFIAAGLLVAAGLRSLAQVVPWVAVAVGAALVVVGLFMLAGRHVGIGFGDRLRPGSERGWRPMVVFGAGYATASLSCTLAVLLAVVAQATATRNPAQMLAVFAAYGAGSGTVLTALAIAAATAKVGLSRWLRRLLPVAGRLGGVVLVASGVYLLSYWLPAVQTSSGRGRAANGLPDAASASLSRLLDGHSALFAVLGAAFALAGTATLVRSRRETSPAGQPPAGGDHEVGR
jgi:cytochrome c biogenesis protein CcdA